MTQDSTQDSAQDSVRDSLPGDHAFARRTVLMGAGVGAGPVSNLASQAQAQMTGAGMAQAADGAIWSAEYWAKKTAAQGEIRLNLWRKRVGAPKPGEPALPVLFLVHGSSNSTRSSYDLEIPGKGEYSFMNVFARYGYDVWTMDHDGYGHSGSSGNNSDIASGVEDLKAAIPVMMQETGQSKMHLYGTSSTTEDLIDFFQQLPNGDRQFVILPNTAHSPGYGNNRHLLWYATRNFLAAPPTVAS